MNLNLNLGSYPRVPWSMCRLWLFWLFVWRVPRTSPLFAKLLRCFLFLWQERLSQFSMDGSIEAQDCSIECLAIDAYRALFSRPRLWLLTPSTLYHFHLRKAMCGWAALWCVVHFWWVLTLPGSPGFVLIILHICYERTTLLPSIVFHTQLAPSFRPVDMLGVVPCTAGTAPPVILTALLLQ
jgi:hypothetical protein